MINNHANEKYDAYLADVFSCGVILWKLLFGYDEWPSEDVEYERRVHREGKMDQFYSINVNKKMQGLPFKTSGKQPVCPSAKSNHVSSFKVTYLLPVLLQLQQSLCTQSKGVLILN